MEVNNIIEELKYYTGELPKEAIKQAIQQKEKITPKLLEMLEYTKNNIDKILDEEDEFFGYIYAFFLLAEFKEKKAFPYLMDLLNRDEEVLEYIIGDDYPEYVPRLLASTYDGNDQALYSIIENREINEFIRCSALQTFAILYLYGVKERKFIVNYFKKLLNEKSKNDNSYLYEEIIEETCNLKLVELEENIDKILYIIENEEEREELKNTLKDGNMINRNIYPFKPHYEYIYDTVGIMEEWQCFRYREDEEFENSDDYKICQHIIQKRKNRYINDKIDIGRNDLCPCGSGKKYKKCCINKNHFNVKEKLNLIDEFVCKAEWYLQRGEEKKAYELLRFAWFDGKENNIKSIEEYDEKYDGYDCLLNWIQDYDDILEQSGEECKLYERLELWDALENIFDLNNEEQLYWKERAIRAKANTEFRLGNEAKATKIIEKYLKEKPDWVWGYIEMSDWYSEDVDSKYYNLEKAKKILLEAEQIKNMEDIDAVYERLEDIYDSLGNTKKSKEYAKKWQKYVYER